MGGLLDQKGNVIFAQNKDGSMNPDSAGLQQISQNPDFTSILPVRHPPSTLMQCHIYVV